MRLTARAARSAGPTFRTGALNTAIGRFHTLSVAGASAGRCVSGEAARSAGGEADCARRRRGESDQQHGQQRESHGVHLMGTV